MRPGRRHVHVARRSHAGAGRLERACLGGNDEREHDTDRFATAAAGKKPKGFTDGEWAAMKERAQELKAEAGRGRRGGKARRAG
jgi:hypothetical protein